jgi:hypothetical protein
MKDWHVAAEMKSGMTRICDWRIVINDGGARETKVVGVNGETMGGKLIVVVTGGVEGLGLDGVGVFFFVFLAIRGGISGGKMTKNTLRNWDRRVIWFYLQAAQFEWQVAGRTPDRGNFRPASGALCPLRTEWVEPQRIHMWKAGDRGHLKGGRTNHAMAADTLFVCAFGRISRHLTK